MARRRQSYRTRQADDEEPRYARSSAAPSAMMPAIAIVAVVGGIAVVSALMGGFGGGGGDGGSAEEAAPVADSNRPKPFADLPPPSDEPFRNTWGGGARSSGASLMYKPVPDSLAEHRDWAATTQLVEQADAALARMNELRDAGDLSWRAEANIARDCYRDALADTEPWIDVLHSQYGSRDTGVRAFMARREDWRQKELTLNKLL